MQILVFKTNIRDHGDQQRAKAFLDALPGIRHWSVDGEDVDCVLRIVGTGLTPNLVTDLLNSAGFFCGELPD